MSKAKKQALQGIRKAARRAALGDKYKGGDKPALMISIGLAPSDAEDKDKEKEKEDED